MEINRKVFIKILSRIKAYKDVIIFRDSPIEGCLDILYVPKYPGSFLPKCVHKMTLRFGGYGGDLFDDSPVEKLGGPIIVFLNRIKEVLQNAQTCFLKDGCINGIRVTVEKSDVTVYSMFSNIMDTYEWGSAKVKSIRNFESMVLRKTDYAYMISELTKFVSKDETRFFMNGICFDFAGGGGGGVLFK